MVAGRKKDHCYNIKMKPQQVHLDKKESVQAVLGYLNFSSGVNDSSFLSHLDNLYRFCGNSRGTTVAAAGGAPLWDIVTAILASELSRLQVEDDAFDDAAQASLLLAVIRNDILPTYRKYHRDLLYHQDDETLFNSFFLGRVFECILSVMNHPHSTGQSLEESVFDVLNDYVGYRPVAVLETNRKMEPYPHERCRPIPLYIRDVGVAYGPYEGIIQQTINILGSTSQDLLATSQFDLSRMEELAIDPRPYDFSHPVNKRPNHQFGLWDPHSLDSHGYYRRFIIQQVTMDSLLLRIDEDKAVPREKQLFEAGAALAGTILMASAVSGARPDAYSSEVTLNTLLPVIAKCRDSFYERLLHTVTDQSGTYEDHLAREANSLRQPFGGVRQHLNNRLARVRAAQLEHVHMARLFAQMGCPKASARQVACVPSASARMTCMIECLLTDAEAELDKGRIARAAQNLTKIVELLHRGIECGAIVDPWNILGFDGNFSLFPALENSVVDHRIGELMEMMDRIFSQFARSLCRAAAADNQALYRSISTDFEQLSIWWDQFAASAVSSVDGVKGVALHQAAIAASESLGAWQTAGVAAGDVRFWQPYADQFDSPKAYVLVIDTLLDQEDFVASMHLLIHWLSQADRIELQEGRDLFHVVSDRWLEDVLQAVVTTAEENHESHWKLIAKFFDYLEANAGPHGEIPELQFDNQHKKTSSATDNSLDENDSDEEELYSAAYEEMIYHDSTDDGIDSELLGSSSASGDCDLQYEARRISDRLGFMVTEARLWQRAVLAASQPGSRNSRSLQDRFSHWLAQTLTWRHKILGLMQSIEECRLPQPMPTPQSLVEYDHHCMIREALLDRIIDSHLMCTETAQILVAAGAEIPNGTKDPHFGLLPSVIHAALTNNVEELREYAISFIKTLSDHNLLYVPLSKGGCPQLIAEARSWQRGVRLLLVVLPRMGMLEETYMLIKRCISDEQKKSFSPGAVTEFDQLFRIGNRGMIDCLISSIQSWSDQKGHEASHDEQHEQELVELLQQLTEAMTQQWFSHSQTLRLSVLEKMNAEKNWAQLVEFIQLHGHDLFTQHFLNLGNLRAILQRGVATWLEELALSHEKEELSVLGALQTEDSKQQVVDHLQVIIESIVDNYVEYRDYNGTTTQSDRGELLYMLMDMLRLRIRYDRVAWNLVPVTQVHEILVRRSCPVAAEAWRVEMMHRTAETADKIMRRLQALQKKYSMRLSTIADRVGERFIRALEIDRVKSLVEPVMDATGLQDNSAIDALQQMIDELTHEPTGVGLDMPRWLVVVEDEVRRLRSGRLGHSSREEVVRYFPQRTLSRVELQKQLDAIG